MTISHFNFPTVIKFGAGAISLVPSLLKEAKCLRPVVITDEGIAKLDFVSAMLDDLKKQGIEAALYKEFIGNPIKSHVDEGVKVCRDFKADALIILGGGAALDVGKAIGLMVNQPGDLFDYEDGKPDALPVNQPLPYMIAIPTTAGTGSEVGRASVISENETKKKRIIFDPKMLPNVVVADPVLTFGLPASITAATGFDALTHNIEAYLAKGFHPICDGIALEGIRLIANNLETAVKEPADLKARSNMLMASMMGAIAFQKGLGLTHSAAHALSTVYDAHHGLANALMLKACMQFNIEACPERFLRMGQAAGCVTGEAFINWIENMKQRVELPSGLQSMGVEINDTLLDTAFADPCHPLGPKAVTREDFRSLYAASM